jgi:hypothetical protein
MNQLDDQLHCLIKETRHYPPSSPQRVKGVAQIIQIILNHPQLLGKNFIANVSHEDYEDALYKTLSRFFPQKWEAFDPGNARFITWFNVYLKGELMNHQKKNIKAEKRRASWIQNEDGEWQDPIENLNDPQPPCRYFELLEKIRSWLKNEQQVLRCIHLRNHPHINCSVLMQKRLLDENSWQQLTEDLKAPIPTLSGFYRNKCLPELRSFLESQDWWPL